MVGWMRRFHAGGASLGQVERPASHSLHASEQLSHQVYPGGAL